MNDLHPGAVLEQVAQSIPAECRPNVIVTEQLTIEGQRLLMDVIEPLEQSARASAA